MTHLEQLEAESIHIIREVAAEFENPVMLYSIGKDSAVMLHLARKAFYPARPPFPLMHVDTTWKFREMITFRDQMAAECGFDLLVHINEEGVRQGINPFVHGSAVHTDVMKTEGLKQALDKYKFDAAFGGARRDEEKSRAKERIFSFVPPVTAGIRKVSDPNCGISTTPRFSLEKVFALSLSPIGPNLTYGNTFIWRISPLYPSISQRRGRWWNVTAC